MTVRRLVGFSSQPTNLTSAWKYLKQQKLSIVTKEVEEERLGGVYGDSSPSYSTVKKWLKYLRLE